MIESLIEHRRLRESKMVKEYLRDHRTDHYCLFATAYFLDQGLLDKYQVQCDVDRFKLAEEVPPYLARYLLKKQN